MQFGDSASLCVFKKSNYEIDSDSKNYCVVSDIGLVSPANIKDRPDALLYMILADSECWFINLKMEKIQYELPLVMIESKPRMAIENVKVYPSNLHTINCLGGPEGYLIGSYVIEKKNIDKIEEHKNNLRKNEENIYIFAQELSKKLLRNKEAKSLLTSFFYKYTKEFFIRIGSLYYFEDDLLSNQILKEKIYDYSISIEVQQLLMEKYDKILELFDRKGLLKRDEIIGSGPLMITNCMREIAIEVLPAEFNKLYGGYFTQDVNSLREAIRVYFNIDLIQHEDIEQISFFTYFLWGTFPQIMKEYSSIFHAYQEVEQEVQEYLQDREMNDFEKELLNSVPDKSINDFKNFTIEDFDLLNGLEFECMVAELFKRMGYSSNLTPSTRDQGVDIIAAKSGVRVGIQTKCYSNSVSNKAIQEIVAGATHYKLDRSMVITNSIFTRSAIELALTNNVVLWDRSILKEKIAEYFK